MSRFSSRTSIKCDLVQTVVLATELGSPVSDSVRREVIKNPRLSYDPFTGGEGNTEQGR